MPICYAAELESRGKLFAQSGRGVRVLGSSDTWVYVRMSTDLQEDSPVTQGQLAGAFCAQHGLTWTRTYYDLGISGAEISKRPGILALIDDAKRLKPQAIVFYQLSRAFRNSYEQGAVLKGLKQLRIEILKVRDPNIDGPQGELIDGILGHVNQFERQITGVRIRDHNMAMAQRGEWAGGPAPYGYTYRKAIKAQRHGKAVTIEPGGLEPDPIEFPRARQMWEWELAGRSRAQILDLLDAHGWRRKRGGPWNFSRLTEFFKSKVYAGYVPFGHFEGRAGSNLRRTHTGEWYIGKHTPVVNLEEWERVQAKVAARSPGRREQRNPRSELSGILSCAECGGPVVSTSGARDGRQDQYGCLRALQRTAGHPLWSRAGWIFLGALRNVIIQAIQQLPASPPATDRDARRQTAEREIAKLQGQLKRLRELYRLGEYGDDLAAYQRDKLTVEAQLSTRQRELTAAGPSTDEMLTLHQRFSSWLSVYDTTEGIAERRQLWRQCIEQAHTDGKTLTVRLLDFGPGVTRDWTIPLPPKGTRMPGSRHGVGVVGHSRDGRQRGFLLKPKREQGPAPMPCDTDQ